MADVMISLDTTGSMSAALATARKGIVALTKTLFKEVPNLRMGVIFHGDYEDAPPAGPYVIRMLDLTDNVQEIVNFVQKTEPARGSWADECYELVLHEARRATWRAGVPKVLAVIGDQNPHPPTWPLNDLKLDWRNELAMLKESNINVYGVQALNRSNATKFYQEISRQSNGYHLRLDQMADITEMIVAVCYKQVSDERLRAHVDHVQKAGRVRRSTAQMYSALLGGSMPKIEFAKSDLAAVPPGRFQILRVDKDTAIRDFVEENGAVFKKGRGFYQFTKTETVQHHKEVVLVDKKTGDMFTGDEARKMIGATPGVSVRVRPGEGNLTDFDCFIQSTSVNRKLKGGTQFLYEEEDWNRT